MCNRRNTSPHRKPLWRQTNFVMISLSSVLFVFDILVCIFVDFDNRNRNSWICVRVPTKSIDPRNDHQSNKCNIDSFKWNYGLLRCMASSADWSKSAFFNRFDITNKWIQIEISSSNAAASKAQKVGHKYSTKFHRHVAIKKEDRFHGPIIRVNCVHHLK